MAKTKYVPISAAIEEWLMLTDYQGRINRADIKKIANSFVRKLTYEDQLRHKIKLIDVTDNLVDLPENFQSIIQVAYKEDEEKTVTRTEIVEATYKTLEGCEMTVSLDCPKCEKSTGCTCDEPEIIMNVDRDYMMAHPELVYGHLGHYYRHGGITNTHKVPSVYHPEFYLISYAQNYMFGADYHIKGCLNLDKSLLADSPVSYTVEDGKYLRLNVNSGQILLSYFEYIVDEEGYRFIPDLEDVFDVIKWGVEEIVLYREWRRTRNGDYLQVSKMAKNEKLEAMGRAREKLRILDFHNFFSFIENHYVKIMGYDDYQHRFNAKQRDRFGKDMDRLTIHR